MVIFKIEGSISFTRKLDSLRTVSSGVHARDVGLLRQIHVASYGSNTIDFCDSLAVEEFIQIFDEAVMFGCSREYSNRYMWVSKCSFVIYKEKTMSSKPKTLTEMLF